MSNDLKRFATNWTASAAGCHNWIGSMFSSGYGRFNVGQGGSYRAHRWLMQHLAGRKLGLDEFVLHSCDNKRCVNPGHLRIGTAQDNMDDAVARGRLSGTNQYAGATHCKHGHEFEPKNTIRRANGNRECKTCRRAIHAAYNARRRGVA